MGIIYIFLDPSKLGALSPVGPEDLVNRASGELQRREQMLRQRLTS